MFKLWQKFKDSSFRRLWKQISQQLQNQKLNRQVVGVDRFGNKYYQYYSFYGLPTRRQIQFKDPYDFQIKDLVYYRWLHNQQIDPPTQQQKTQYYLQEQKRFELGRQADQLEQRIKLEFRRQREELLLRNQAIQELMVEHEAMSKKQIEDIKTKREG